MGSCTMRTTCAGSVRKRFLGMTLRVPMTDRGTTGSPASIASRKLPALKRATRPSGLRVPSGALVANVVAGSPAARAGLKSSDLIVAIDGQTVDDPNGFDYRFATRPLGGSSQVDVQRGGKTVKLTVPLETAPDTGRNEVVLTTRSPFQGAKVANISPAVADELHLDADTEGVVVTELGDDTTAANVGFQKGDIILAVNNQKIGKTSDLEKATRDSARLWRITLVRGGQQINVTLGG